MPIMTARSFDWMSSRFTLAQQHPSGRLVTGQALQRRDHGARQPLQAETPQTIQPLLQRKVLEDALDSQHAKAGGAQFRLDLVAPIEHVVDLVVIEPALQPLWQRHVTVERVDDEHPCRAQDTADLSVEPATIIQLKVADEAARISHV